MLGRLLRAVGWALIGIVALCVLLYFIAIVVNWRDQEPSANAVRFAKLYRDRPALRDDSNAYVFMMGFAVAPGEDPHELGLARLAWIHGPHEGTWLDPARDPLGDLPDYRSARPPAIANYLEACGTGGSGCIAAFDVATDGVEQWLASDWLLKRYVALISHAGWREEVSPHITAPFPSYGLIVEGQRLLLLDAKVLARKGEYRKLRELLSLDLSFWRRVLESSDTLLTKMVATAAINRHFSLGNLVLRTLPPDRVVDAIPAEWRMPFSNDERSMLRCMVGEWVSTSAMLQKIAEDYSAANEDDLLASALAWLSEPFYKPQATINGYAGHFSRVATLLNVPLDQYESALAQASELARQAFPPRSLYNVMGQTILGMGSFSYDRYARRIGDVEGVRRAALATVSTRAARVTKDDVPASLASSPLRNPYNDRPFEWDGEAVVFHGLESGSRGEHRFDY